MQPKQRLGLDPSSETTASWRVFTRAVSINVSVALRLNIRCKFIFFRILNLQIKTRLIAVNHGKSQINFVLKNVSCGIPCQYATARWIVVIWS